MRRTSAKRGGITVMPSSPASLRAKRSNPESPRGTSLDCFVADAARNDGSGNSPPQPFRRTLLGKRLRTLDIVLRADHRLHRRIVALLGDRLFQRDAKSPLDGLLGGADRHRRVLGN